MKEVLLNKEEALRIAISILSGRATNKDFGSAALKDTESILKNILETEEVAREMLSKPQSKPSKPNKKRALSPSQRKELQVAKNLMGDWKNVTILDLEENK